jgi:hypothetical protein
MARRPHRPDDEVQLAWAIVTHNGYEYRYCEALRMGADCESESSDLATSSSSSSGTDEALAS